MPDRSRGRVRLRDRVAARTGLAAVARALSDYAVLTVPTSADGYAEPGEWIRAARHLGVLVQEYKFRAVVVERERGASWEQIARALNFMGRDGRPDVDAVRDVFEEPYEAWKRGERHPWTPPGCMPVVPDAEDDPEDLAASLDQWYSSRTGDGVLVSGLRPVSDGLGLA